MAILTFVSKQAKRDKQKDSLQLRIDSKECSKADEELQDGDSTREDTIPTPHPVGHSTSIYITAMPSEWQDETKYATDKHIWVSSPTHPHYRKRVRNFELNPVTEEVASEKRKSTHLLPPQTEEMKDKKTLVLDLDETLVHSGFEGSRETSDFVLSMQVENTNLQLFVKMRPYLKEFLQEVTKHFEIVIFTASMVTYADPVIDLMFDATGVAHIPETHRLFRESWISKKSS
ncbi:Carboxy-terminal domain RNA polymerase II polypeptide A small phosphatase 2 [Galdieria sulphuraria]|nr:Carboxy-terminal domain RNA polymerase II polypeptide A small phosphatase 2 [Galdieria sulphuraria]